MTIEEVRLLCLSMPMATEDLPFGPDYVTFRIAGKIFAGLPLERPGLFVLKCTKERFEELTDRYRSIEQAWHWHKRLWMQIHLDGDDVSNELVTSLINEAYTLVRSKLPRAEQARLAGCCPNI